MLARLFARRWTWLALSMLVCAAASGALLVVHHREQEAREREQIARAYAAGLQQASAQLMPIGVALLGDPDLLGQITRRAIAAAQQGATAIRPIDPARADQISATYAQVLAALERGGPAGHVAALVGASRVRRLALEIASREHRRATVAGQQALYGGIGVLVMAVMLIAAVLRREQTVVLTSAQRHADQLRRVAEHDGLTGLPNRRRLDAQLDALTDRSVGAVEIAICDLNGFKEINDRLGHHAGDSVLITTAHDLQRMIGTAGTVYRTGGDEFCVVSAPGVRIGDLARRVFERDAGKAIASVGVATWPADHDTAHGVVRLADRRMYAVKRASSFTPS